MATVWLADDLRHDRKVALKLLHPELRKSVELGGTFAQGDGAEAAAYARAGDRVAAERILRQLERRAAREYVPPFAFAAIYAALDDRERGIDWLLRGIERRDNVMAENFFDPLLDPLRQEPRYRDVLAGMGLSP